MSNPNHKKNIILKLVERNPGVGFLDIQKETGYANGVLSHHLKILERDDFIRIRREKRKIWVFPLHLNPDEDNIRIHIRKETCKKIIEFLLDEKKSSFIQIRKTIGKSPSTTSITLKMLIQNDIVRKIPGFTHEYALKDHDKTAHIMEMIRMSRTDLLKDRFADTFSYL
ncbi:MAG: winged helix-turn-helix transcriptional regulator [Nitrosarchaeum sp.]|nr:winged helix-turn-helix transcriptional regulator [Nitrosarchaeum sp.]MCA9819486.1 winged helix-turn-helix transcriptional regulator [Nitrosarchaeum sp.]